MEFFDKPPTYEESMLQNANGINTNRLIQKFHLKGPDAVYYGKKLMIVDFLPWSQTSSDCEDLNYLLLRVNDWLFANRRYNVRKCEFIPRMIDSRKKLDQSKCYIFNLTFGRTYFVNELRLHILVEDSKTEPDKICINTYIPKRLKQKSINVAVSSFEFRLQVQSSTPVFEDMPSLLSNVNNDIKNGLITGVITNLSTFYAKIDGKSISLNKTQPEFGTMFYSDSSEPKYHLKALRVFYKPGKVIDGSIGLKCFSSFNKSQGLDQMVQQAMEFIFAMKTGNFLSMETFPEFKEDNQLMHPNDFIDYDSTLVAGERFMRLESLRLFYFKEDECIPNGLFNDCDYLKILWVVPRKTKYYENYGSFMEHVNNLIAFYDTNIIDMETILVPNSLKWSQVRHQTLLRYHNESCTNYHIYAIKLIIKCDAQLPEKLDTMSHVNSIDHSNVFTHLKKSEDFHL